MQTRKSWLAAIALVMAIVLCGCIDHHVLVQVKKDGSGVVRVRYLKVPAPDEVLYNKDRVAAVAAQMGEGVVLLRSKEISREGRKGFLAEYSFTDISKLHLEGLMAATPFPGRPLSMPRYRFEFAPGEVATLSIQPMWEGSPPDALPPTVAIQDIAGLTLAVHVQAEGEVTETNAAYRSESLPNAVTLLYFSAEKLAAGNGDLGRITQANGFSAISELILSHQPGLRIQDPNGQVTLKFK
jgi:hypothetical protein